MIDWWLTSTLAVFQLYRGMTIYMYHTRGEHPNLHHRCGSILDTWSVILNTIVSIKPNRRKVWRYEKGNQSHQKNINIFFWFSAFKGFTAARIFECLSLIGYAISMILLFAYEGFPVYGTMILIVCLSTMCATGIVYFELYTFTCIWG